MGGPVLVFTIFQRLKTAVSYASCNYNSTYELGQREAGYELGQREASQAKRGGGLGWN